MSNAAFPLCSGKYSKHLKRQPTDMYQPSLGIPLAYYLRTTIIMIIFPNGLIVSQISSGVFTLKCNLKP